MMRASSLHDRRGVSILEMVAGMGILITALALFATAEYAARRSTIQHLGRLDAQRDLTRTLHQLREDLRDCSRPPKLPDAGRTEGPILTLEVAGRSPVGDALPGVTDRILYERGPIRDGSGPLIRRVAPGPGSDRVPQRTILTRRLERLELQAEGRRLSVDLALRGSTGLVKGGSPIAVQLVLLRQPLILEEGK